MDWILASRLIAPRELVTLESHCLLHISTSEALCEGQQLGYNRMRLPQSFLDFESGTLPPPSIYKYVPKERIKNILSENLVRFTPLVATNDPFEIRETFKRMSGPEHRDFWMEALSETVTMESIDAMLDVFIEKMAYILIDQI